HFTADDLERFSIQQELRTAQRKMVGLRIGGGGGEQKKKAKKIFDHDHWGFATTRASPPVGEPAITILAILIKKPSSMTPVMSLTWRCSSGGSAIVPNEQSRM